MKANKEKSYKMRCTCTKDATLNAKQSKILRTYLGTYINHMRIPLDTQPPEPLNQAQTIMQKQQATKR